MSAVSRRRTTIHINTLANEVFHVQKVNVEWTIRKLKPKLSQLLGSDGTVPADDLVLVSPSRGVLSDHLTVEEAGLCDGTATVLTRAQHAAATSASASANQQRGQSPSRATTATATAAPAPLASSLKKHDSVATAQRKKARVSSSSPAAASSPPQAAFKVRVVVTVSASGDVVLKGLTPKHTFGRLIKLLSTHTGVAASHLTLLFDNVPMADTDTLGSAGLTRDGHELVLVRQHREEAAPARPRGGGGGNASAAGTGPADRRSAFDADDTLASSSPGPSTVAGPSARMSVTLETPAGDVRQVFVRPGDAVRTVQVLAGDNWGVPADGVVVNAGGMPLHPRQTLAHAGVRAGARLLVTLTAPQGQLAPCAQCGLPKSTPFCTVTGQRHDADADADADAADVASVFNPPAASVIPGDGGASRRRGDGLPVPLSADPFVTISVLSQADGKEYRLPSMRPASVTVRRVKELLARNTGTEPVDMALRSGRDGTLLADNRTLAQAGIENGETLVLHESAAGRPRPPPPPPPVPPSSARALEPHTLGLGRTYPTLSPPKIFPLAGGDPDTHPLYDPRFESGTAARDGVRTQLSYEDAAGGPTRGRASRPAEDHPPAYDHIPPAHLPPHRPPPPPQAFGNPAHSWLPEPGEAAAASALAARRVKELLEENRLLGEEVGLLRDKSAAVEQEARTQIDDLVEENEQLQAAVREREREERYLREDLQRAREHARRRPSVSASERGGGGGSGGGGGPSRSNPGERVGSTTYDRHGRVVTRTSSRPASASHLPPHPASGFSSSQQQQQQQQPTNIVHHVVSGPPQLPPPPPPHPAFPAPRAVSERPSSGVAATDPVWGLASVRASPAVPAWLGRRASQREEEEAEEAAAAAAARRRRRREAEWEEEEEENERRRREREARWEEERRREREADANVDRALASISGGSGAAGGGGGGDEGEGTAPPRIRVSAPASFEEKSLLELHEANVNMHGLSERELRTELRMEAARKAELQRRQRDGTITAAADPHGIVSPRPYSDSPHRVRMENTFTASPGI